MLHGNRQLKQLISIAVVLQTIWLDEITKGVEKDREESRRKP